MDFVLVIYYRREMLLYGNLSVGNDVFLHRILTFETAGLSDDSRFPGMLELLPVAELGNPFIVTSLQPQHCNQCTSLT